MKLNEQIKALAELDGRMIKWKDGDHWVEAKYKDFPDEWYIPSSDPRNYLTSYDAIIPLIQKHWSACGYHVSLRDKPIELSEALLRATGKWKD